MEFMCDPDTTDMIVDLIGNAAADLGTPTSVIVPAAALLKLGGRLAASGVTIPDNADLAALQDELRKRGDLPDLD